MNDKLLGLAEKVTKSVMAALDGPELSPTVILQSGLSMLPKLYAILSERPIGHTDAADIIRSECIAAERSKLEELAHLPLWLGTIDELANKALDELNTPNMEEREELYGSN